MKYAAGIDIGGTNTRVAVIDEQLNVIDRTQFRTDIEDPYKTIEMIRQALDKFDQEFAGIGVSCPGPLDLMNAKILDPPNLKKQWWDLEIAKKMSEACGCPVYLENDANLAALAEAVAGEGKNYHKVQFLTISTGVGAGLVIDKEIYIGAHGFANEIANMCMWQDGPSHGQIHPGGIEAIASGTAITARAKKCGLDVKHAGEVNELALAGDKHAAVIMDDAKQYLANALAGIYAIVDPDIIILGGSVALKIDGFVEEVQQLVKKQVYANVRPIVKIVRSTLDEDSGLIGAGYLALRKSS